MRLLVIEDDDAVRSAIRRALLLAGYEVLLAADGEEGLLKAGMAMPDAIPVFTCAVCAGDGRRRLEGEPRPDSNAI